MTKKMTTPTIMPTTTRTAITTPTISAAFGPSPSGAAGPVRSAVDVFLIDTFDGWLLTSMRSGLLVSRMISGVFDTRLSQSSGNVTESLGSGRKSWGPLSTTY